MHLSHFRVIGCYLQCVWEWCWKGGMVLMRWCQIATFPADADRYSYCIIVSLSTSRLYTPLVGHLSGCLFFCLFFIFPKCEAISGWSLFYVQVWSLPVSLLLYEPVMQSSCSDAVQNRMLSNCSALFSSLFSTKYVSFLLDEYRVYSSISMNTGSWLFNMCILSLSVGVKCCGIHPRVC